MDHPAVLRNEILAICPEFEEVWGEGSSIWCDGDGNDTVHGLFSVLSRDVADLLEKQDTKHLGPLFTSVEQRLTGSNEVQSNAAATCFLENLMNRVPELFSVDVFEPMLGSASREFCRRYAEQ